MSKVYVLDFGGQYTQLIARRVRLNKVFSEIVPSETPASKLRDADGIILSGGPSSVYDPGAPGYDPNIFHLNIPVLGICYGMQLMAYTFGGTVSRGEIKEYGETKIRVKNMAGLFLGLEAEESVWMSHGDSVLRCGLGFEPLATTEGGLLAAMCNEGKKLYGVQFHPEVTHTEKGNEILANFLFEICHCSLDWTMEDYISKTVKELADRVGKENALVLVSGGIDSVVAYVLVHQALGDRVYGLHVDNGLMRKNESAEVEKALRGLGVANLHVVDCAYEFLECLSCVTNPEEKRKRIGDRFVDVMEREMRALGLPPGSYIVQGTLYTDMIESGRGVGSKADVIKTHHNVNAPRIAEKREQGLVFEPNQWIFKDEVRRVGELLGLPDHIVQRHPFPGPGLAVRIISNIYFPDDFEAIDARVAEIAHSHGLTGRTVPIATVGVQGDERTYRNLVVIEGKRDWLKIKSAVTDIVMHTPINRAAFVLADNKSTANPRIGVNPETLSILREADHLANSRLEAYDLYTRISQMPVVIYPDSTDGRNPAIGLRPVVTDDFMTARPAVPGEDISWEYLDDVCRQIGDLGIGKVVLDVTDKPPGTIEWE